MKIFLTRHFLVSEASILPILQKRKLRDQKKKKTKTCQFIHSDRARTKIQIC